MIDRSHRFHGFNALNFVHKQGKVIRSNSISLKYALNQRRETYRVAVVVSKKVSKSAVVRNRIRRRVFEAVRLQSTNITQPYDLVFMVYNEDVATAAFSELQKTVTDQLNKAMTA